MLGQLAAGDVVTVTRIDRLARSTFDPVRYRQAHRGRQGAIPIL
jgi:DNA invertase Pin-like site-specific DNA recombinase